MTIDYKSVISHFCNGEGLRSDLLPYKNVEIFRLKSALQRRTLRQGYGMTIDINLDNEQKNI